MVVSHHASNRSRKIFACLRSCLLQGSAQHQNHLTPYALSRLQGCEHLSRCAPQKLLVQFGQLTRQNDRVRGAEHRDHIGQSFQNAVWRLVEDLRRCRAVHALHPALERLQC